MGNYQGKKWYSPKTRMYSVTNDEWKMLKDAPGGGLAYTKIIYWHGYVYLFGGVKKESMGGGTMQMVYRLKPEVDEQWEQVGEVTTPILKAAMVIPYNH